MLFGATPFATTTFAGVGAQSAIAIIAGNRLNISLGTATAGPKTSVEIPNGNRLNLAIGSVSVVSWQKVDPNATGNWIEINPLNP
tara:strand:- start:165 stop:419 length:255 start_codon:yes stop_codon:yes gene_type:complete